MEGIEDSESPTNRAIHLPGASKEDAFHTESVSSSLGVSMARPLDSRKDGETVGPKGIIKKEEFIKIIIMELDSLGYKGAAALLQEESGIQLHSPAVESFMQQVLHGNWDEVMTAFRGIDLLDESFVKSASFLISEQKFLDLLKKKDHMAALLTLRNDIVPLSVNSGRVHELAACIFNPSQCVTLGVSSSEKSGSMLRSDFLDKLQKVLPAAVMIPGRRMEHLVEQALGLQRDACVFHNTLNSEISLYSNHRCGRDQIPSHTLQILREHKDEVQCLQFSHNGKYLASSSKDKSTILWEVIENGKVVLKHKLHIRGIPVFAISWKSDDSRLLTCTVGYACLWDVSSGAFIRMYMRNGIPLLCCGWLSNGNSFVSSFADKFVILFDADRGELVRWQVKHAVNISDIVGTEDGKRIISLYREDMISLLDREKKTDTLIKEEQAITSFSLSKDDNFLLVNLANGELHLWRIAGDLNIVSKFKGPRRTRFLIRSCFGGLEQGFIASGSEDSLVYIWHRSSGILLAILPGHSAAVNCVSWDPVNPHRLASASDDGTIRIWGLEDLQNKDTLLNPTAQFTQMEAKLK